MKFATILLALAGLVLLGAASTTRAYAASPSEVSGGAVELAPVRAPNQQACSGTPTIQYAYANPPNTTSGQTTTLLWGLVGNADVAYLQSPDGKREGIGTPGSKQVSPTQTSTWQIIGMCGNNSASLPITVNVGQPAGCSGNPVIQFAYANPPTISAGQVTTLYWGLVGNANAAYLQYPNGNREGIGTPGSKQVNPTKTSTYLIIGVCGANQVQTPITVTVNNAPGCNGAPVISSFTANPTTISRGQFSLLNWGLVSNAQSVQLSSTSQGGSGVPTPGQINVSPSQTTTYYLTAWCQSNSVQQQVTITVQ